MSFNSVLTAELLMSLFTVSNVTGVIRAIFYIASVSMKTVIPLRIAGIASTFFFLVPEFLHARSRRLFYMLCCFR